MAFPSGSPLARALQDALAEAGHVKALATNKKALLAAASQPSDVILDIQKQMHQSDARLAALAATPGLAQYAKDQFNNQGLDIAAEFTTLRNAIQAVRDGIESDLPKDANGWLLINQFSNHAVAPRMFTVAQTANLRTLLQAVIDAVA